MRRGGGSGRGRLAVVAVLVVVAVAGVGAGWAYGYNYGPSGHGGQVVTTVPASIAVVRLGTITQSEEDSGTVGYAGYFTIYGQIAGTVTWLPASGAVIRPGQRLFAINGQDAVLMRGQTPAWRAFTPGMTDGPDVAGLQRNMIALGYDLHRAITVDGSYDWATQAAVERWQAHEGWPQDAQIPAGQVAFLPGDGLRVAAPYAALGSAVAPGAAVLGATSTTPVVTVGLPAQEQTTVTPGQRVAITLPDGSATSGRVLSVGSPVGSAGSSGGSGSGGSGSGGSGPGAGSSGTGGAGSGPQATVNVVTSIAGPVNGLDGAPVQVAIATATQQDALIVPIDALLAGPGGSYQVTVVSGAARHDVTVTLGLFDDLSATVGITGPGIAPGTRVVVPAS